MKKFFAVPSLVLLMAALFFAGCGEVIYNPDSLARKSQEQNRRDPSVANMSDTLRVLWFQDASAPAVFSAYEKDYRVKLEPIYYRSIEEMLELVKKHDKYDLLLVPTHVARKLIVDQELMNLNLNNIPNINHLDAKFNNAFYDPGHNFSVPFLWGSVGLAYDSKEMRMPTSWKDFFNPDGLAAANGISFDKRISLLSSHRLVIGTALLALHYDPNTTNRNELDQAKALLLAQKPKVSGFADDRGIVDLVPGHLLMSMHFSGPVGRGAKTNSHIRYVIPDEGVIMVTLNIVVPKKNSLRIPEELLTEKRRRAEHFINYLLTPLISAQVANYSFFATANASARPYINQEVLNGPSYMSPKDPNKSFKLDFFTDPATSELYMSVWRELFN